jgi:hypothetical protein
VLIGRAVAGTVQAGCPGLGGIGAIEFVQRVIERGVPLGAAWTRRIFSPRVTEWCRADISALTRVRFGPAHRPGGITRTVRGRLRHASATRSS